MAKYCDHGLYPVYAAVAAAGVAYDGDGLEIGLAVPATVSIDLNGFTAAAGNTVAVAGASLSCVASGATANQFNAASSGAALATNLASAINAATAAIVITNNPVNPILGWRAAQLRDVVYASAVGTVLTIQTRAGSAKYNNTDFFKVTSSGLTGGAALDAKFNNGVSGAWGYLINTAAIWPTNLGVGGYGLFAATQPIAGVVVAGDAVRVRSGKTITLPASTNVTWTMAAMGSAAAPVLFAIDDSTTWADGTDPVLKISQVHAGNTGMVWLANNTTFAHILGKQYASGQRNLVLEVPATVGPSLPNIYIGAGGYPIRYENIEFSTPGNSTTSSAVSQVTVRTGGVQSQVWTHFVNCKWQWPKQNNGSSFIDTAAANSAYRIKFTRCEFGQTDPTVGQDPVLRLASGANTFRMEFEECKFSGMLSNSRLIPASSINTGCTFAFKNCDLGLIKHRGPNIGTTANSGGAADGVWAFTKHGARDFFIDNRAGFVEWNSAKGYPTLAAKLLDGVTGWVIFAVPTAVAGNISKVSPLELPAINKYNTLATGGRTATLNLALESSLTWTMADISLQLSYIDSTGVIRLVDTYDPLGGALTADPASTWSSESGGQVTYNGQTFNKLKFSVAVPDLANGCELTAVVRLHSAVANETLGVLIDPELKVA